MQEPGGWGAGVWGCVWLNPSHGSSTPGLAPSAGTPRPEHQGRSDLGLMWPRLRISTRISTVRSAMFSFQTTGILPLHTHSSSQLDPPPAGREGAKAEAWASLEGRGECPWDKFVT